MFVCSDVDVIVIIAVVVVIIAVVVIVVDIMFLDASSHLYESLSVRQSVHPSAVRFFLNCKNEGPETSQKCRIASLQDGRYVGPSVYS